MANNSDILYAVNRELNISESPLTCVFILASIAGVVGNLFTVAFYRAATPSSTTRLIIALACVDTWVCLSNSGTVAFMVLNVLFSSDVACKGLYIVIMWSVYASVIMLLVISIDRYFKLCRPLGRQIPANKVGLIVAVVVLSTGAVASRFVFKKALVTITVRSSDPSLRETATGYECTDVIGHTSGIMMGLQIIEGAGYVVTCVTLVISYSVILHKLLKHRKMMMSFREKDGDKSGNVNHAVELSTCDSIGETITEEISSVFNDEQSSSSDKCMVLELDHKSVTETDSHATNTEIDNHATETDTDNQATNIDIANDEEPNTSSEVTGVVNLAFRNDALDYDNNNKETTQHLSQSHEIKQETCSDPITENTSSSNECSEQVIEQTTEPIYPVQTQGPFFVEHVSGNDSSEKATAHDNKTQVQYEHCSKKGETQDCPDLDTDNCHSTKSDTDSTKYTETKNHTMAFIDTQPSISIANRISALHVNNKMDDKGPACTLFVRKASYSTTKTNESERRVTIMATPKASSLKISASDPTCTTKAPGKRVVIIADTKPSSLRSRRRDPSRTMKASERRVSIMMCAASVAFLCFILPSLVMNATHDNWISYTEADYHTENWIPFLLPMLNSVVNPFLYFALNKRYRVFVIGKIRCR